MPKHKLVISLAADGNVSLYTDYPGLTRDQIEVRLQRDGSVPNDVPGYQLHTTQDFEQEGGIYAPAVEFDPGYTNWVHSLPLSE